MTPASEPVLISFALQGDRAHVRATDVLAAMMAQFRDRPLSLKFARPLSGPAVLVRPARPGAAVVGQAGAVRFSLDPDPDMPSARRGADRTRALHLGIAALDVFAFWPATPLAARIAAIFDRLHPHQTQRFHVRQITLHPGPVRCGPILWTRLTIFPDRARARLQLSTPAGQLATLEFHLTPRDPALPQSTG